MFSQRYVFLNFQFKPEMQEKHILKSLAKHGCLIKVCDIASLLKKRYNISFSFTKSFQHGQLLCSVYVSEIQYIIMQFSNGTNKTHFIILPLLVDIIKTSKIF